MKVQELFDNLVRNALDFMNRALDEIEHHPKFALIDFAAAVELVFKARVVLIGSMWLAEEPTEATPERFSQGKLRTIGLDLAKKRIESLTNERIDTSAFQAFQVIARHRNRVVHFFHTGLDSVGQREAISSEIYVAWYHLYGLLSGLWRSHYSGYLKPISEFGARLQALTPFLDAVFTRATKNNPSAAGYAQCPVCTYKALDAAAGNRYRSAICHVCGYAETSHKAIQDGDEEFVASCAACDSYQTAHETAYGFKCSGCGESFSDSVSCGYCDEHFVGVTDPDFGDSYTGCEYCGGAASRIGDD